MQTPRWRETDSNLYGAFPVKKVAQRVDDKDIMHLLKLMLKASGSALGVLWGFAGAVQPAGYSIETGRTRR